MEEAEQEIVHLRAAMIPYIMASSRWKQAADEILRMVQSEDVKQALAQPTRERVKAIQVDRSPRLGELVARLADLLPAAVSPYHT